MTKAKTHRAAAMIEALAERNSAEPLVSLYLTTSVQQDRLHENTVRLKNVLSDACDQLQRLDVPGAVIDDLRARTQEAAHAWEDGSGLDRGLGIFIDSDRLDSVVLPFAVDDRAVAGPGFYLKPLFAALRYEQRFWLLALSQNRVSLYQGDGFGLREVDPGDEVPESLSGVVGYQPSGKALHFHAGDRGGGAAIFHGHGAGKDDANAELERFLRAVDRGLHTLWQHSDLPVVLAGVEDLSAMYRGLSECRHLLDASIEGNVEDWSEAKLHRHAWPLVAADAERRRDAALDEILNADPDVPVSRKLPDVLQAAAEGRVDSAWLAADLARWGRPRSNGTPVEQHERFEPGDTELIDLAAVETYRHGGHVHMVTHDRLPTETVAIARLRY